MSNRYAPVPLIWLILAALVIVVLVDNVWAGGECNGTHNCNDDSVVIDAGSSVVGGDTAIDTGGNKSVALVAPGLGDVDIAQCLGSEAWTLLIGGKQRLVLNQVCMAEFYLKQGRYDLAAQSLCNQPEIIAEYDTEQSCELAHDFTPAEDDHDIHTRSEEFEAQHTEEIERVQVQQAGLVAQLDDLAAQLETSQRQPAPVIAQQVEQYSDDQFDAVWSALKGGDEDE